ncbi:MAG: hypothetical protein ACI9W4_002455 [Rhodothermales bacterium]|jgi:hypothetical protein
MRHRYNKAAPRLACLFLALLASCQTPADPDAVAVAWIDDQAISARELVLDYELGMPILKRGPDPVRGYLQGMIHERLLAREGYRRGFDETEGVRAKVRSLQEELMVAEVFEREVHVAVEVTSAEVDSIRFSEQVSFKLRFLPAASLGDASRLRSVFESKGHGEAVRVLAASEEGLEGLRASEMETDYVTRHDLAAAILQEVDRLPIGAVSGPIAYRGSYLLVQVADVRRGAVTATPGPEELERYTQVAFQANAKRASRAYVKKTMAGVDLRLKAGPYRSLEAGLWEVLAADGLKGEGLLTRVKKSGSTGGQALLAILDEVLLETATERWTVRDFLSDYPADRYPLSRKSYQAFRSDLYDAFGLLLRDRAFLALAQERDYELPPEVKAELKRWEDKWVYHALAASVRESISVSPKEAAAYFERHRSFWAEDVVFEEVESDVMERARGARARAELERLAGQLAAGARIRIDEKALASLDLKAGTAPTSLFHGSTGRPAWPVLDYGL